MTQRRLNHAVAGATGESLRTIRRLRFSVPVTLPNNPDDGLRLVVDCPFCRQPVLYVGPVSDGAQSLAECLTCDVYFDHDLDDVYAAGLVLARAAS